LIKKRQVTPITANRNKGRKVYTMEVGRLSGGTSGIERTARSRGLGNREAMFYEGLGHRRNRGWSKISGSSGGEKVIGKY